MVCVTKGRQCGQLKFLPDKKLHKNQVINKVGSIPEKMKKWAFLKSFFGDRSRVIYRKPYLGEENRKRGLLSQIYLRLRIYWKAVGKED